MNAITLVSLGLGVCILFTYRVTETRYLTISNGTRHLIVVNQITAINPDSVMAYLTFCYVFVANNVFIVILVVVNVLLYAELRNIMERKQRLLRIR